MPRSYPPRPSKNFRITSFGWQLDNEANHRNAGFPQISEAVLARRFWQYLQFNQLHGLTTRRIVSCVEDITADTELRNDDLTPEGYLFAQRYCDKWVARMHKDVGEEPEEKLLTKWLHDLRTESVGA